MVFLHPSALQSADAAALQLVPRIARQPPATPKPQFPTERPVAPLTDDDVIEIEGSSVDASGRVLGRFFWHADAEYGLDGDDYLALRRVAEGLLKNRELQPVVNATIIEETLFGWCRDRFRGIETRPYSSALVAFLAESVVPRTLWFPIAELEVQKPFKLGVAEFAPVTTAMLNSYEAQLAEAVGGNTELAARYVAELREKVQGRAAVVLQIEAAEARAVERGLELAEAAVRLLALLAPGSLSPWHVTTCAPVGAEYIPSALVILHEAGGFRHRGWLRAPMHPWQLSAGEIDHQARVLASLGELLEPDGLTDFHKRLRTATLTFSKAASYADLNDRLVYTFSALEGLLLKDGSEPIQQNLGERMAFMNEKDPAARQRIVQIVKEAYKLRSQYVHHQVLVDEGTLLEEFIVIAWRTIFTALDNLGRFKDGRDFVAAIDRVKFGSAATQPKPE